MKKLMVLFPGIGYTCDKPLLYYSSKMAPTLDYDVLPVPYVGFPKKVKGDRKRMRESFEMAFSQAEEMLQDVRWDAYEDVVFVSKSIGTVVASCYAARHGLKVRSVLFTPLAETFEFVGKQETDVLENAAKCEIESGEKCEAGYGAAHETENGKAGEFGTRVADCPHVISFHGTSDPWAETLAIQTACEARGIPLYLTEGANHSLETGDVLRDIENLGGVMRIVRDFLQ